MIGLKICHGWMTNKRSYLYIDHNWKVINLRKLVVYINDCLFSAQRWFEIIYLLLLEGTINIQWSYFRNFYENM